jgi:glycosyltransferase involved in cell wall biosynthesis
MSLGRILFIHNSLTEFVQLDLEALRKRHVVTEHYEKSRVVNPAALWRMVRKHDLVFGWFASWHTFLPLLIASLSGKPSVLIVGGYDVANMPEIGYGHQRGGLKKWISRKTMRCASHLVTISKYSRVETIKNAAVPAAHISAFYLGVPDRICSLPQTARGRTVLTVGNVNRSNLLRKGHEPFVRAAALLPDVNFVLVGDWQDDAIDYLRRIATSNVTFTGRVKTEFLLEHYRNASVYVQASLHEGFGMSVAEAMLAGCVPVTTNAGALSEVTGDHGIRLTSTEPAEIANAVEKALNCSDATRGEIRARILENFSQSRRNDQLQTLIEPLLSAPSVSR